MTSPVPPTSKSTPLSSQTEEPTKPGPAPTPTPLQAPPLAAPAWSSQKLKEREYTGAPLENRPEWKLVPESDRKEWQHMYKEGTRSDRAVMLAILTCPAFAKATPNERAQLFSLMRAVEDFRYDSLTKSQGNGYQSPLEAIASALEEKVYGRPRLLAPGTDGKSALEHLARLARGPLDPAVAKRIAPETSKEVLAGMLQEIADPRRIQQDSAGSCTVTSAQSFMALRMPGEYARIVVGLAVDGSVKLASGQNMKVDIDGLQVIAQGVRRTVSERIFQASLMQWAGVERGNYVADDKEQSFRGKAPALWQLPLALILLAFLLLPFALILGLIKVDAKSTGLSLEETKKALEAVTSKPYALHRDLPAADRFEESVAAFDPWGKTGGHAVVLVGVDRSRTPPELICRNPWGSDDTKRKGDPIEDAPSGTVFEDPNAGLIRIPLTPENEKRVLGYLIPRA